MLKLLDITKEYKVDEDSVLALHGVSIEFRRNEFVSILGPSGCGKTTLLNIIGGLDRYTAGDIQIDGISTKEYDDVDWDTYRNRRIGFVFQSYNLIPHMNILKNVAMSLTLAGVEKEERRRLAMAALKKVGLESQAKKKPNQLSGGQMQRVAIARALVNNPEIILADEPTGALDSESGIQVMELLKEVAKDRLVIMVTHNPQLANDYSTRIVYLKDGEVEGDTMPYDSTAEKVVNVEEVTEESGSLEEISKKEKKSIKKKGIAVLKALREKRRKSDKSSMKLRTAISLSFNNLLSKKGRTFLTSIAGSIGIIGIILVLALSNGASIYINSLEENALSSYPITIAKSNVNIGTILSMFLNDDSTLPKNPESTEIHVRKILGNVIDELPSFLSENDLKSLKKAIEKSPETFEECTIKYNYGVGFNAYYPDPGYTDMDGVVHPSHTKYMKVEPYLEVMEHVMNDMASDPKFSGLISSFTFNGMTMPEMLSYLATYMTSWCELSTNQKLLDSQYELVDGTWPQSATDVVLVVDSRNQFKDYELFMLGLKSEDEVLTALLTGEFATTVYPSDQLIGKEYTILADSDYIVDNGDGTYTFHTKSEQSNEFIESVPNPIKCKVSGIIRPKPGASVTSISGVCGYTHELTKLMLERSKNNPAVKTMLDEYEETGAIHSTVNIDLDKDTHILVGQYITDDTMINNLMIKLGVIIDEENPNSIDIYCSSFEAKEKVEKFIQDYNDKHDDEGSIKYSDTLSTIMGFVDTMSTTITGVLVAFAAISLVVSTIMIAIIIYTSVLERKKEIGVLRSIGARKKDISRVFIAESAMIGGYSGMIGVIVSVLISLLGTYILKLMFQIDGLMTIQWWYCVAMIAVSVVLSIIAGFVPSRIAAKKDPAIALRSE